MATFYDNPDLGGEPVMSLCVGAIEFDWEEGSPGEGLPADGLSVRFVATVTFEEGSYSFVVQAEGGVRIWLGGEVIWEYWKDDEYIDHWEEHDPGSGEHVIVVEFFDSNADASITFYWFKEIPE